MVREVTARLADAGHEITVFATDVGDERTRVSAAHPDPRVVVHSFRNASQTLARKSRAFLPFGMRRAIRRAMATLDVVHVVDYRHLPGTWAIRSAARSGVPSVLAPHGSLPNQEERRGFKKLYDRLLGRRDLDLVAAFQVLNDQEAESLETLGVADSRIHRIPNGVTIPPPVRREERSDARRSLGIHDGAVVALYMGRLVRRKGLIPLIRAVSAVRENGTRLILLVAGSDDGLLAEARALVGELALHDQVMFMGFIEGGDKRAAFAASDLFALWSEYEGQPMAVLEALAYALPVVVTEAAAVPGLAGAGLVIRHQGGGEGVNALESLAVAPSVRAEMGARGREMVSEHHGWESVVHQYESLYSSLCPDVEENLHPS